MRIPRLLVALSSLGLAAVGCSLHQRTTVSARECPVLATLDSLPSDTTLFDTLAVTARAERVDSPPVRYPADAREAHLNARVVVDVNVDRRGRAEPGSEQVVAATHQSFVAPALEMIRLSRFCPASLHGRPVRVRVRIPINFRIVRNVEDVRP